MGNLVSQDELSDDLLNLLIAQTGFNKTQIHRLFLRYEILDKDKKGYLVAEDLLEIPQVRIFLKLFQDQLTSFLNFIDKCLARITEFTSKGWERC